MDEVRQFGEEKQWDRLTSLFIENTEYLGWELAAITVHLLEELRYIAALTARHPAISCISSFFPPIS